MFSVPEAGREVPLADVVEHRHEPAAPLAPGDKQVAVTYFVPAGRTRLVLPVDQPTAEFQVLAEDSLTAPERELRRAEPLLIEGRVFQRFVADSLSPGAAPAVRLSEGAGGWGGLAGASAARAFWWIPVGAVALLLLAGAWYALRVAPR